MKPAYRKPGALGVVMGILAGMVVWLFAMEARADHFGLHNGCPFLTQHTLGLSPVTNLRATLVADNGIDLSWDHPNDVLLDAVHSEVRYRVHIELSYNWSRQSDGTIGAAGFGLIVDSDELIFNRRIASYDTIPFPKNEPVKVKIRPNPNIDPDDNWPSIPNGAYIYIAVITGNTSKESLCIKTGGTFNGPYLANPEPVCSFANGSLTVSWDPILYATHYKTWLVAGGRSMEFGTDTPTAISRTHSGPFIQGFTNKVRVQAFAGSTSQSRTVDCSNSFTPPAPDPETPTTPDPVTPDPETPTTPDPETPTEPEPETPTTPDPETPDPVAQTCTYEHRLINVPATTGGGYTSQISISSKDSKATVNIRAYQAFNGAPMDVLDSDDQVIGSSVSLSPANSVKQFSLEAIRGWHIVIVEHPSKAAMQNATVAMRLREPDTGVSIVPAQGIEQCTPATTTAETPSPDLVIRNTQAVLWPQTFDWFASVVNIGDAAASPTTVRIYHGDREIDTKAVESEIAAGSEWRMSDFIRSNRPAVGDTVRICVDSVSGEGAEDRRNNCSSATVERN